MRPLSAEAADPKPAPPPAITLRGPATAATALERDLIGPGHVQGLLERIGSGLAATMLKLDPYICEKLDAAPGMSHNAAMIITRASLRYRVATSVMLVDLQREQGLLRNPLVRSAAYQLEIVTPKPGEKLTDPGPRSWLSKGRLVRLVAGDETMAKACGAGIPDPALNCPWSLEQYLGFDRQIYQSARLTRSYLDQWAAGQREIILDSNQKIPPDLMAARLVTECTADQAAGTAPVRRIVCADPFTFRNLRYTPWLAAHGETCRIRSWIDSHA